MPEVTLRPAHAGDIPAVLAFWARSAENADRPSDEPDAVAALIAGDPEALILATDGPELVGTVVAGWDGWRCHVYRLAVDPDRRRRGIGRLLLDAAERRFRALGGIRADAMVLDANEQAHRVWKASGYQAQENWSRWVKPLHGRPPSR
jgi:ribosomal protein S18 acetylase RimI-like enzyme